MSYSAIRHRTKEHELWIEKKEKFSSNLALNSTMGCTEQIRLEYIKSMIDVVKEDTKHILLNISVNLGVTTIMLTQDNFSPSKDSLIEKATYLLSISLISISSAFFFAYLRDVHRLQMRFARNLINLDAMRVYELFSGPAGTGLWTSSGWKYRTGRFTMAASVLVIISFVMLKKIFPLV